MRSSFLCHGTDSSVQQHGHGHGQERTRPDVRNSFCSCGDMSFATSAGSGLVATPSPVESACLEACLFIITCSATMSIDVASSEPITFRSVRNRRRRGPSERRASRSVVSISVLRAYRSDSHGESKALVSCSELALG